MTYRQELRRCGNSKCRRCVNGPGHGPYWYAYYRDERGKLHSRYLGKSPPPGSEEQPVLLASTSRDIPAAAPPCLRLCLLGTFSVERNGVTLVEEDWPRRSARQLLALLALHPSGLLRDEVCEALWPDREPAASAVALRAALSVLRRVLEPGANGANGGMSQRLSMREPQLRLHLYPGDWVDVHVFTAARTPRDLSIDALVNLAHLYAGELLPMYHYEEWTMRPREALRSRWHALCLQLAQQLSADGQPEAAMPHLRAILADDPTQEEAARALMLLLTHQGHRDEALRVYYRLHEALDRELGVSPDVVTRALVERVRRDDEPELELPLAASERVARLREHIERLTVASDGAAITRRLARMWAEQAIALESMGEPETALHSVATGQLVLGSGEFPAERSRLLLAEATVYCKQGQARRALETATQAEQQASTASERGMAAWALRIQAQALDMLGRPEQALALARSSAALFSSLGAAKESLHSRRVLAFAVWRAGKFAEALALSRHNLAEAQALKHLELQAYIHCNLGQVLWMQGEMDAAEPHLHEAMALAMRLDDSFLQLSVEYQLGNLWAERAFMCADCGGDALTQARRETRIHFERSLVLAQAQQSGHMIVGAASDLAATLAQWGELEQARPLLLVAQNALDGLDDHVAVRAWTMVAAAEIAWAEGDIEAVLTQVTAALPLLEQGSPPGLAPAHRLAAQARTTRGDEEIANRHWQASLSAAARCGQKTEEARTRRAMAHATRLQAHPIG